VNHGVHGGHGVSYYPLDAVICDRKGAFLDDRQAASPDFVTETRPVRMFQQSRPRSRVNLDRRSEDFTRDPSELHGDKFPSLRHGRVTQRFIPIHRITRPTLRPQSNTRLPGMPVAGKVWLEPSRV
jgi:hypothetical protein